MRVILKQLGYSRYCRSSFSVMLTVLVILFTVNTYASLEYPKRYSATVTASALNVRSGPGSGYPIIGKKYRNQSVYVTHHNGAWRRIAWPGGRTAYVYGSYLRPKSTSTPSSSSVSLINIEDYTAYVSASSLNVRNSPSTSGTRTNLLGKHAQILVTHRVSGSSWVRIKFYDGTRTGYVHSGYIARAQTVDMNRLQQVEGQNSGAADRYLECMIGKFTSTGSLATKAWTIFRNGVKQGLKKIVTSPFIAVNHQYCLVVAQDWAEPPKPYSPQAEQCTPAMGFMTGCKELDDFYGTPEGIRIWDAFQFTGSCDKECKLTCYFHGKKSGTYNKFINDPYSKALKCRY